MAMIGKHAALPLELLDIAPNQPYRGVVPDHLKDAFLKFSTQKPQARAHSVRRYFEASPFLVNQPKHSLMPELAPWPVLFTAYS